MHLAIKPMKHWVGLMIEGSTAGKSGRKKAEGKRGKDFRTASSSISLWMGVSLCPVSRSEFSKEVNLVDSIELSLWLF